jgi:hypothetical protein
MVFEIGARQERETYRMRSSAEYQGDYVESHARWINGRKFDFTRIFWGDGTVSVSATPYGRTDILHHRSGRPEPLTCGHVPSYGCDCDTITAEASAV